LGVVAIGDCKGRSRRVCCTGANARVTLGARVAARNSELSAISSNVVGIGYDLSKIASGTCKNRHRPLAGPSWRVSVHSCWANIAGMGTARRR
jgi:hypothetical protein